MGKVLCVIDHFGSGGAQRQLVELACGLRARGHDVQAFVYFPHLDFFKARLDAAGIRVHARAKGRGFSVKVCRALARLIDGERFDAVISFLDRPNTYAVLARLVSRTRPRLVVSERSQRASDRSAVAAWIRRQLYRWTDAVVANSQTHADWLRGALPDGTSVHCIYNGLDVASLAGEPLAPPEPSAVRLLAVGRMGPEKNALAIVQALQRFHHRHGHAPRLAWAGRRDESPEGRSYAARVQRALDAAPEIAARWEWLGERADVPQLLRQHHALVHASFFEGLPNAVCEALAVGRPVLASRVCDHPRLVAEGVRGFLFDPADADDLRRALESLTALTPVRWAAMQEACRDYAQEFLTSACMVGAFERVAALGLPVPSEPAPGRATLAA